jgi:hypothetical protein
MSNVERHAHWENVYQTKGERDVSWFEESPRISLDYIRATEAKSAASITLPPNVPVSIASAALSRFVNVRKPRPRDHAYFFLGCNKKWLQPKSGCVTSAIQPPTATTFGCAFLQRFPAFWPS